MIILHMNCQMMRQIQEENIYFRWFIRIHEQNIFLVATSYIYIVKNGVAVLKLNA